MDKTLRQIIIAHTEGDIDMVTRMIDLIEIEIYNDASWKGYKIESVAGEAIAALGGLKTHLRLALAALGQSKRPLLSHAPQANDNQCVCNGCGRDAL
jgi:hypothetical protein